MTPHERLDAELNRRRVALDMTWADVAAAARIHEVTLRSIRRGASQASARTKRRIEDTMGWRHGSIDDTLNGGQPTPAGGTTSLEDVDGLPVPDRLAQNEKFMRLLKQMPADEQRRHLELITDLIRRGQQRTEEDLDSYVKALVASLSPG